MIFKALLKNTFRKKNHRKYLSLPWDARCLIILLLWSEGMTNRGR